MAGDVAKQFSGLPIRDLIVAPIEAVAQGQADLIKVTIDTLQAVAFDKDKKTQMISFPLERPVTSETGIGTQKITVNAPLVSLITLPNFAMKTADVEFTMEVKDSVKKESGTDVSMSMSAHGGWLFGSYSMSGSVSAHSSNTRETDNSAKYDVKVHAEQLPPSEGMARLADVFASVIQPIPVGA